jgi:hypothetical protein
MPFLGHDISPLKNELHHTKNCPVTSERFSPMAGLATVGAVQSVVETFLRAKQNPNCFRNWGFGI